MATKKRKTVPVGLRAVLKRVNRVLEADSRILKRTRGGRAEQELGRFFVVDLDRNIVVDRGVDLEALARKLGALEDFEHVDE